MSRAVKWVSPT